MSKTNSLPIAVGYADDITCIIQDSKDIQKIFKHYENFTNVTGLELNADKTEILSNNINRKTSIKYLGQKHIINNAVNVKINGVIFNINYKEQFHNNWESGIKK